MRGAIHRSARVPAGDGLSRASAGVAASAAVSIDLLRNGTQVGTLEFAAGGTEGSFFLAAAVDLAPGDVLSLRAPTPADTTLADLSVSLVLALL